MTVLRKRVDHDGIELADPDVLRVIAERIPDERARARGRAHPRGRLRLADPARAHARGGRGGPVGPLPARGHGPGQGRAAAPTTARISIDGILDVVCEAFSVSREDLVSSSRAARVAWPRQLAMYLARSTQTRPLPSIGRHFGGRTHTTSCTP
jgi:chromosomal replication initiator protein